jgi:hypothetical protein
MLIDKDLHINSLLLLFKSKANNGHVPEIITGLEIYEHFKFKQIKNKNYFFNRLCYIESVLEINPGEPFISTDFIDNNYLLKEPYLTQIRRECKIDAILG